MMGAGFSWDQAAGDGRQKKLESRDSGSIVQAFPVPLEIAHFRRNNPPGTPRSTLLHKISLNGGIVTESSVWIRRRDAGGMWARTRRRMHGKITRSPFTVAIRPAGGIVRGACR
jgi:hypothetical protein